MAAPKKEVDLNTSISVKISYQGTSKKFKLPLGELGPSRLPGKLHELLAIPEDKLITFERFSDSAGAYQSLEPANVHAYKSLYRAAKAKGKLRLKATSPIDKILNLPSPTAPALSVGMSAAKLRSLRQKQSAMSLDAMSLDLKPILTSASDAALSRAFMASDATLNVPAAGGVRVSTCGTPQRSVEGELKDNGEAPVPKPFPARELLVSGFASASGPHDLALRVKEEPPASASGCSWSVYCNACDDAMPDEHYHCNICDNGDYDLCASCIAAGKHCLDEGHWLIKRTVKNGKVVNSTTRKVLAPPKVEAEEKKMPGAFAEVEEKKPEPVEIEEPTRTCNSCVKVFEENQFVTCQTCEDFDLCISCHNANKHGHHPAHAFKPAVEGSSIGPLAEHLAPAGRNVYHNALCDNCDEKIYSVRHKCLDCPDWDYCAKCFLVASTIHPGHRFATLYDAISHAAVHKPTHVGIYCDGPLCNDHANQKTFIRGTRYKCAICHDTDFCACCEASPSNKHNRTHPLIKFKTPVRNVSVSTLGEDKHGSVVATMGDKTAKVSASASTSVKSFAPSASTANTVSKVQPIVDVKPVEEPVKPVKEKIEIKDLLAEPIKERLTKVQDLLTAEQSPLEKTYAKRMLGPRPPTSGVFLNAHFIRDTITDGTKMVPNQRFIQIWTLKNPGPHAWPAGCRVRYVGGDNMLNVEDNVGGIANAVGSNIMNRVVAVDEEVHFRVVMKAPQREGTSISYWRLKSPDNVPFGHRLWCHIDVANPEPISPAQALEQPATHFSSLQNPSGDREMFRLLEEFKKKRVLMAEAIKKQEERVKEIGEMQKRKQKQAEEERLERIDDLEEMTKRKHRQLVDEERARRVQILRAMHAARLAAVSAEKKENAANMKPVPVTVTRGPPPPTVEEVAEKEEVKAEPEVKVEPEVKAEPEVKVETEKSTMIFPKLEKESPVSSTHELVAPSSPAATAETVKSDPTALASPVTEVPEIFEDAESVDILDDSSSSDDGFLTDEEYDILGASDEEFA